MHKAYRLRRNCCIELSITLCLGHLEARLKDSWKLVQDNGVDSLPCYDCVSNLPLPTAGQS